MAVQNMNKGFVYIVITDLTWSLIDIFHYRLILDQGKTSIFPEGTY